MGRSARSVAIANEIDEYLTFLKEKVLPYARLGSYLPAGFKLPQPPDEPDCLVWLDKVDRWGLPCQGTFMDQPMDFLDDMEAARMGRERFRQKLNDGAIARDAMAGAPPPVAMVGG